MTDLSSKRLAADILIIAPYCGSSSDKWFSPGRQRKLFQVESLFVSLGYSFQRFSISPDQPKTGQFDWESLCSSSWPPVRFVQLFFNAFWAGGTQVLSDEPQWIWIYNTRLAEAMVALALLIRKPKVKIFLQLEDLPAARLANAGVRGRLDSFSSKMLSRRADCVSAVSLPVALAFSQLTSFSADRIVLLPPLLDDNYRLKVACRQPPFGDSCTTIVYAGGYGAEKGIDDLLAAFSHLPVPGFRLLLLGPIPYSLRVQLSGQSGIEILGMVPIERLFLAYAEADILVNPHRPILNSSYVFPFKLIEIMASGALPLSTAMPGLESFGLPSDCIFFGCRQLSEKLVNASRIWRLNRQRLERLAQQLRESHSMAHARDVLYHRLGIE